MPSDLIREFLRRSRNQKLYVTCLGDAMVDEYEEVLVNRISPECAFPVMQSLNKLTRMPGGAANVVRQLRHLSVHSSLLSILDESAFKAFQAYDVHCLRADQPAGSLPIKRRFMQRGVQVSARYDIEKPNSNVSPEHMTLFYGKNQWRQEADVVIFSDYDKGFFSGDVQKLVEACHGSLTLVDPKHGPVKKWRGCSVFKPNAKEAEQLSGKRRWQDQALYFQDVLECDNIVITFSGEKVAGLDGGELFDLRFNRSPQTVSDVGAGDCFAAFLGVAAGLKFSMQDASRIAFEAGSVYVHQGLNEPVHPLSLIKDQIVRPEDLRDRSFRLGVARAGAVETLIPKLSDLRGRVDKVAVLIDDPAEERIQALQQLRCVDYILVEDSDPEKMLRSVSPDVIV